jgi:hypothetical protein
MGDVPRAIVRGFGGALVGGAVGGCVGGVIGLLLTAFNNLVLVPRGEAAYGTYTWWTGFLALLLAIVGAPAGFLIGLFVMGKKRESIGRRE